jgi:hypothetical protein
VRHLGDSHRRTNCATAKTQVRATMHRSDLGFLFKGCRARSPQGPEMVVVLTRWQRTGYDVFVWVHSDGLTRGVTRRSF